jgi:hypothetical protein
MRLSAGRAFQGPKDYPLDLGIAYLAGRSRSGFVIESFQTGWQKAGAPFAHHAQRDPHFPCHGFIVEPFGAGQHHPRASSQQWLAACPMGQRLQPIAFLVGQNQSLLGSPSSHRSLLQLRGI